MTNFAKAVLQHVTAEGRDIYPNTDVFQARGYGVDLVQPQSLLPALYLRAPSLLRAVIAEEIKVAAIEVLHPKAVGKIPVNLHAAGRSVMNARDVLGRRNLQ